MGIIEHGQKPRALVSVKGHPYPRAGFFGLLESMDDLAFTAVEQPASQLFFTPRQGADYDALRVYDMPGVDVASRRRRLSPPPAELVEGLPALLEEGQGCVFLH